MERMKRALCLLLCFVMVVGLVPLTAFAADNEVSGTGYLESLEKITSLSSGDTIIIGDGNGNYLVRNNTSITTTTDPAQATEWTVGTNGSYYTLSNGGYYLRPRSGNSNYSLNINSSSSNANRRNWSYDASTGFNYNDYYLRYNNGWAVEQDADSGYGAAYTYSGTGASVTFTASPKTSTMLVNTEQTLTTSVTLGSGTVSASNITWSSNNFNIASVENGVVTAKTDGTATITATLNSVNGTSLVEPIELEMTVTVQSKQVTGITLTTAEGTVYDDAAADAVTGGKLLVTYDNGDTEEIDVTLDMLSDSDKHTTVGTHEGLTVTYAGHTAEGFTLTVVENPAVTGSGSLVKGTFYVLDTDGIIETGSNNKYLIVAEENDVVMYQGSYSNNNSRYNTSTATVTVQNGTTIEGDYSDYEWYLTDSGFITHDGTNELYHQEYATYTNANKNQTWTYTDAGDGKYILTGFENNAWNLYYTGSAFRVETGDRYVRMFKQVTGNGGEVVFSVAPRSADLLTGTTTELTGKVLLNGEEVDLRNCTITWASSDNTKATVSGGTVTGIADGEVNITATLSAVNGSALEKNIVLSIPVSVSTKAIVSAKLSSLVGNVSRGSNQSADTGTKVVVTYEDGETAEITVTPSMITAGSFDLTTEGTYTGLTVTYGSHTFPGYTLVVNPKAGNNYPQYPDPGAVDVNKYLTDVTQFQNTGVANVELTTSGIPVQTGVDAVLVIDVSNSMSWATGTKTYNANNKLDDVMAAVKTFANILLADNEDGTKTNNTMSIVIFGGYDASYSTETYVDATQTLVVQTSDVDMVNAIANGTYFTAADTLRITYQNGNGTSYVQGSNRGDTNYDWAFQETNSVVDKILANNGEDSEREIHVLFMSDGCPTNLGGVYYRTNSADTMTYPVTGQNYTTYSAWATANGIEAELDGTNGSKGAASDSAWMEAINTIIANNGGMPLAKTVYSKVTGMYGVGFDMANGSFSGIGSWDEDTDWVKTFNGIISKLAGYDANGNGYIPVTDAANTTTLNNFYESLAREIRYAATNAYFVDQMGDDFDLQLASYVTKFTDTDDDGVADSTGSVIALNPAPAITVSSYKIYTSKDVDGTSVTTSMIGERYGNPTVLETVVFSADGTKAYSDVDGYNATTTTVNGVTVTDNTGSKNILVDGVVCAKNFWYNTTAQTKTITLADGSTYDLPAETFYWNIGTINETEYVLNYAVYLEGAAEGLREAGTYETNEYATLNYINWLGNKAFKDTTSPLLTWGGAQVSYGFYLVDENGNPVTNQTTGATGSFYDAVKVTQSTFYSAVNLNSTENVDDIKAIAANLLPNGYSLYDTGATYTIRVDSGNALGGWVIETSGTYNENNEQVYSTYVTDFNGSQASNAVNVADDTYDYSHTTVWFAVKWIIGTVPDVVVVDYGLPVDITVLGNDMFGENGKLVGIGAADPLNGAEYGTAPQFGSEYDGSFGSAVIKIGTGGAATSDGSKVRYTPATMEFDDVEKFVYEVEYTVDNTTDIQYYYGDVTVIPAATIYYEDNFKNEDGSDFITYTKYSRPDSSTAFTESNGWSTVTDGSNHTDATQAEDRPGTYSLSWMDANNVYGYDAAYDNMTMYSLGTANKLHVDANNYGTATFTFYGTGFDIIALTDSTSGFLLMRVYKYDEANNTFNRIESVMVDTYFGYVYNAENDKWVVDNSGDQGAIYQVPVMQCNDLEYGRYKVELIATYYEGYDHTADEGYDLYLDAVRIYDPIATEKEVSTSTGTNVDGETVTNVTDVEDVYSADTEGWPTYFELRNNVLDAASINSADGLSVTGLVFIDGIPTTANYADYVSYGPNNELYLAPGQAIAFNLDLSSYNGIVAAVHLGIKSATDKSATYKIFSADAISSEEDLDSVTAKTLNTSTDMYYDMTSLRNKTIVILNSGSEGILSITNLKLTFTEEPAAAAETVFTINGDVSRDLLKRLNTDAVFNSDEQINVSLSATTATVGDTVTVTVTTSNYVEALSVNGNQLMAYTESEDDQRQWTTNVECESTGGMTISVIGYNGDGAASEPVTATVTVSAASSSTSTIRDFLSLLFGWLFGN